MPIVFGSNGASVQAVRRLDEATKHLDRVFERLSSGQRINRAADDAAGLSVISNLNIRRRVFTQGIRNFNDGLSLLNVADSTVQQLSGIVERLRELSTQAASGNLGLSQRKALDAEAQQLKQEYFRISRASAFNKASLFDGGLQQLRLQGGFGLDGGISSGLGGALGTGMFNAVGSNLGVGIANGQAHALGDINNDGNLDYVQVLALGSTARADVRLGSGGGSFTTTTTFSTSLEAISNLLLRDVNNDGHLDFIISGSTNIIDGAGDGIVEVRLGNGNGTFGSSMSFATGTSDIRNIQIADLNNDGRLDIVAGGTYTSDFLNFSSHTAVLLGQGNGNFSPAATYGAAGAGEYVVTQALADLNGDGILDLVAVSGTIAQGNIHRSIRFGNGDGTFQQAATAQTAVRVNAITLADINGDGIPDLVSAGVDSGAGVATIELGTGNGSFGTAVSYSMEGLSSSDILLADINGDGILDMITAGSSTTGRTNSGVMTIRIGNGNGTFGASLSNIVANSNAFGLLAGDFNNDGVLDIVANSSSAAGYGSVFFQQQTKFGISDLLEIDLTSIAGAKQAMSQLKQKSDQLIKQRGDIGSFQSRLDAAINTLQAQADAYAEAESRIKDADLAREAAELTRNSIIREAASAVLAQANIQPKIGLDLLGNL